MQCSSLSQSRWVLRVLAVGLALMLALALLAAPAQAAETDGNGGQGISLSVQEEDAPGYDGSLLSLFSQEQYYLVLEGKLLVAAQSQEELTELVEKVAESYVTEDTVSYALTNQNQLQLGHGMVPGDASTDLEAAAETLADRLLITTVDRVVREETVPYRSIEVEDEDRYTDEEPIVTPGHEGLSQVTEEISRINGEEEDTEVLEVEVLQAPVDQVTTVGTKERPEYIWPAQGRISSKFGPRNIAVGSKNHKGIDIAVSHGSDIVAAKAGTVIYAQWNDGGYGYLVKIEHEDGDVTYYAHNSSLVVEKGDQVEQGQVIAKAGSTGRSSGTHCHFEIREDGTPVNPLDYLD